MELPVLPEVGKDLPAEAGSGVGRSEGPPEQRLQNMLHVGV